MDSPVYRGSQNSNQERVADDAPPTEGLNTLILDVTQESSKLAGVCVTLNLFNNIADFKCNAEIYKTTERILAKAKVEDDIRYHKMLDTGKGNFLSNMHVVFMNEKSQPLFALENIITFELNVEGAWWVIPVKNDQCTLGDVVREAHAVMAYMRKMYTVRGDERVLRMSIEQNPVRYAQSAKGHSWIGFRGCSVDQFASGVLALQSSSTGFGRLKYLCADEADPEAMRIFLKSEGQRPIYAIPNDSCETKTIFQAGYDASEFDDKVNGTAIKTLTMFLKHFGLSADTNIVLKNAYQERSLRNQMIHRVQLDVPIQDIKFFDEAMAKMNKTQFTVKEKVAEQTFMGKKIAVETMDDDDQEATNACMQLCFKSDCGTNRMINIVSKLDLMGELRKKFYKDDTGGGNNGNVSELMQMMADAKSMIESQTVANDKFMKENQEAAARSEASAEQVKEALVKNTTESANLGSTVDELAEKVKEQPTKKDLEECVRANTNGIHHDLSALTRVLGAVAERLEGPRTTTTTHMDLTMSPDVKIVMSPPSETKRKKSKGVMVEKAMNMGEQGASEKEPVAQRDQHSVAISTADDLVADMIAERNAIAVDGFAPMGCYNNPGSIPYWAPEEKSMDTDEHDAKKKVPVPTNETFNADVSNCDKTSTSLMSDDGWMDPVLAKDPRGPRTWQEELDKEQALKTSALTKSSLSLLAEDPRGDKQEELDMEQALKTSALEAIQDASWSGQDAPSRALQLDFGLEAVSNLVTEGDDNKAVQDATNKDVGLLEINDDHVVPSTMEHWCAKAPPFNSAPQCTRIWKFMLLFILLTHSTRRCVADHATRGVAASAATFLPSGAEPRGQGFGGGEIELSMAFSSCVIGVSDWRVGKNEFDEVPDSSGLMKRLPAGHNHYDCLALVYEGVEPKDARHFCIDRRVCNGMQEVCSCMQFREIHSEHAAKTMQDDASSGSVSFRNRGARHARFEVLCIDGGMQRLCNCTKPWNINFLADQFCNANMLLNDGAPDISKIGQINAPKTFSEVSSFSSVMQGACREPREQPRGKMTNNHSRVFCDDLLHEGGLLDVCIGQSLRVSGTGYPTIVLTAMLGNDNATSLMSAYAALLPMMLQACKRVADKGVDERAATMVLLAWWDTDALRDLLGCIGALNGPTCVQGALLHALHKCALDNRFVKLDAKVINDAKAKAKAGLLVREIHSVNRLSCFRTSNQVKKVMDFFSGMALARDSVVVRLSESDCDLEEIKEIVQSSRGKSNQWADLLAYAASERSWFEPTPGVQLEALEPPAWATSERLVRALRDRAMRVSATDTSLLVSGESGAGKSETNKQLLAYLQARTAVDDDGSGPPLPNTGCLPELPELCCAQPEPVLCKAMARVCNHGEAEQFAPRADTQSIVGSSTTAKRNRDGDDIHDNFTLSPLEFSEGENDAEELMGARELKRTRAAECSTALEAAQAMCSWRERDEHDPLKIGTERLLEKPARSPVHAVAAHAVQRSLTNWKELLFKLRANRSDAVATAADAIASDASAAATVDTPAIDAQAQVLRQDDDRSCLPTNTTGVAQLCAGLLNQGSTCYLSAAVQILHWTGAFRRGVANSGAIETRGVLQSLCRLFGDLSSPGHLADTVELTGALGIRNVHKQEDAPQILDDIFMKIEAECASSRGCASFENPFSGTVRNSVKCNVCGQTSVSTESFHDLKLGVTPRSDTAPTSPAPSAIAAPKAHKPETLTVGTKVVIKGDMFFIKGHDPLPGRGPMSYSLEDELRQEVKGGFSYQRKKDWVVVATSGMTSACGSRSQSSSKEVEFVTWHDLSKWDQETRSQAEEFISRISEGHTTPLGKVWKGKHTLAVGSRDVDGKFTALMLGLFGNGRGHDFIFSVFGTRVEVEGLGTGVRIVRYLTEVVAEVVLKQGATTFSMDLPDGGCHRKVNALLLYCKCGWKITRMMTNGTFVVKEEELRSLLSRDAFAEREGFRAEYVSRKACEIEQETAQRARDSRANTASVKPAQAPRGKQSATPGSPCVHSALRDLLSPVEMQGSNQFKCNKCGCNTDASCSSSIHTLPLVLAFQLKRFGWDRVRGRNFKINTPFKFELVLDMNEFVHKSEGGSSSTCPSASYDSTAMQTTYELYAVLVHDGNANTGHYYALIKELAVDRPSRWHKFDDARVKVIDEATILEQLYGSGNRNGASAYMLFYRRLEAPSSYSAMQTCGLTTSGQRADGPAQDTSHDSPSLLGNSSTTCADALLQRVAPPIESGKRSFARTFAEPLTPEGGQDEPRSRPGAAPAGGITGDRTARARRGATPNGKGSGERVLDLSELEVQGNFGLDLEEIEDMEPVKGRESWVYQMFDRTEQTMVMVKKYLKRRVSKFAKKQSVTIRYEYEWMRKVSPSGYAPRILGYSTSEQSQSGTTNFWGQVAIEAVRGYELEDYFGYARPSGGGWLSYGLELCRSLAKALRHVHGLGLQHQDLHESNVMVLHEQWAVVLIDPSEQRCHDDETKLRSICRRAVWPERYSLNVKATGREMDVEAILTALDEERPENHEEALRSMTPLQLQERVLEARRDKPRGKSFAAGQRVRATFIHDGRPTWFEGTVKRVILNTHCDVLFDDDERVSIEIGRLTHLGVESPNSIAALPSTAHTGEMAATQASTATSDDSTSVSVSRSAAAAATARSLQKEKSSDRTAVAGARDAHDGASRSRPGSTKPSWPWKTHEDVHDNFKQEAALRFQKFVTNQNARSTPGLCTDWLRDAPIERHVQVRNTIARQLWQQIHGASCGGGRLGGATDAHMGAEEAETTDPLATNKWAHASWTDKCEAILAARLELEEVYSDAEKSKATETDADFTAMSTKSMLSILGELKHGDVVLWIGPAIGKELFAFAEVCRDVKFIGMEANDDCVKTMQRMCEMRGYENVTIFHQHFLYSEVAQARSATHVFSTHLAGSAPRTKSTGSGGANIESVSSQKVLFLARGKFGVMPTLNWTADPRTDDTFSPAVTVHRARSRAGALNLKGRYVRHDEGSCMVCNISAIAGLPGGAVELSLRSLWVCSHVKLRRQGADTRLIREGQGYYNSAEALVVVTAGTEMSSGLVTVHARDASGTSSMRLLHGSSSSAWRYPLHPEILPLTLRKLCDEFEETGRHDDATEDCHARFLRSGKTHLGFEVRMLKVEAPVLTLNGVIGHRDRQQGDGARPGKLTVSMRSRLDDLIAKDEHGKVSVTSADQSLGKCADTCIDHMRCITTGASSWPIAVISGLAPFKVAIEDVMDLMWGRTNMRLVKDWLTSSTTSFAMKCIGNSLCFRSIEVVLLEAKKQVGTSSFSGITELFAGVGAGAEAAALVFPGEQVKFLGEINLALQSLLHTRYPDATIVGDLSEEKNRSLIPPTGFLLVVTFPCQPNSIRNHAPEGRGVARRRQDGLVLLKLLLEPLLRNGGYEVIVLENVFGMLRVHGDDGVSPYADLTAWLNKLGVKYNKFVVVDNAFSRGLPLLRNRIFWVLTLKHGEEVPASKEATTSEETHERDLCQTRGIFSGAGDVLPGVLKSAVPAKFDDSAFNGARLLLPKGVLSGGTWSSIHSGSDGRTWWNYTETPTHGHRLGRVLVWQYFPTSRDAPDCWALMWYAAEDVGLWENNARYEWGLYAVLGKSPDQKDVEVENGWTLLERRECATYEGIVRAEGSDSAAVELEGRKKTREAGHHGYGMLVESNGHFKVIDAKGQLGSLIQLVNCIQGTCMEQTVKLRPEHGGKVHLEGHLRLVKDLRASDLQCKSALMLATYAPGDEYFTNSDRMQEPSISDLDSVETRELEKRGFVILKGVAMDTLQNTSVNDAVGSFVFQTADNQPTLQPDGLRRSKDLMPHKEACAAIVALFKKRLEHIGVKVVEDNWQIHNLSMIGLGPGGRAQIMHKDSHLINMLSIIIAGGPRSVLFQNNDFTTSGDDAHAPMSVAELEAGDMLIFKANLCHAGGGWRDKDFKHRSLDASCAKFYDIPLSEVRWMIHGYAAVNLKHKTKLHTFPCHLEDEEEGEETLSLPLGDNEKGVDMYCALCQLGIVTESNQLLICDGKYGDKSPCGRVFHLKCLELEHIPEDDWLCPICTRRGCEEATAEALDKQSGLTRSRWKKAMQISEAGAQPPSTPPPSPPASPPSECEHAWTRGPFICESPGCSHVHHTARHICYCDGHFECAAQYCEWCWVTWYTGGRAPPAHMQMAYEPVEAETEVEEPDGSIQVEMVVEDAEGGHVHTAESDGYSPQPSEAEDAEVAQVWEDESDGHPPQPPVHDLVAPSTTLPASPPLSPAHTDDDAHGLSAYEDSAPK